MFKSLLIVFFVFVHLLVISKGNEKAMVSLYKNIIETLAADNMQGRAVSSTFESKAADYIQKQFAKVTVAKPIIQDFQFTNPDTKVLQDSKNVYCYINNKAKHSILIGAHYDHIGLGETKSLSYNKKGEVHNGADDNASGVALMIGLLNRYDEWSLKRYNYIFVAYSAHEIGLFGSRNFQNYISNKVSPLALVINFDMVGRLDPREKILAIYGYNSIAKVSSFFTPKMENMNIQTDENDMVHITDAGVFAAAQIPALSFTTGTHDDYHKVSDDAKYINYEGMVQIANLLESFLKTINI